MIWRRSAAHSNFRIHHGCARKHLLTFMSGKTACDYLGNDHCNNKQFVYRCQLSEFEYTYVSVWQSTVDIYNVGEFRNGSFRLRRVARSRGQIRHCQRVRSTAQATLFIIRNQYMSVQLQPTQNPQWRGSPRHFRLRGRHEGQPQWPRPTHGNQSAPDLVFDGESQIQFVYGSISTLSSRNVCGMNRFFFVIF